MNKTKKDGFWSQISYFIPVECKWRNNNKKVGIKEFRDFVEKIRYLRIVNFALFVTNTSFTRDVIKEKNMVYASSGVIIGLIDKNIINKLEKNKNQLEEVIYDVYKRTALAQK